MRNLSFLRERARKKFLKSDAGKRVKPEMNIERGQTYVDSCGRRYVCAPDGSLRIIEKLGEKTSWAMGKK